MALRDLTLEITRKCPMNCKLCSSNGGEPCNPEFSLDELKGIVNQAKDLGVTEISLSGGEPFTCPFLGELCKYISDFGIDAFIFTSGNWFDENGLISSIPLDKFTELKNSGVKKVVFSLHGSNADIHDGMTRRKGSFTNLLQSIENAQKADLELEVHVVPVKDNYRDIPSIVNFLGSMGVKSLHILRFVPQGRGKIYRKELELDKAEQSDLNATFKSVGTSLPIKITVGAHFNEFEINTTGCCTAGIRKAVIRPDGYVFPCVGMKCVEFLSTFDIKSRSLKDIIENSLCFVVSREMIKTENCCLAQKLANNMACIEKRTPDKSPSTISVQESFLFIPSQ